MNVNLFDFHADLTPDQVNAWQEYCRNSETLRHLQDIETRLDVLRFKALAVRIEERDIEDYKNLIEHQNGLKAELFLIAKNWVSKLQKGE